jgi:hypothetical protein
MTQKSVNWETAAPGFLFLALLIIGIGIIGSMLIALFAEVQQAPWPFLAILISAFSYILTLLGNYAIQIRKEQIEKKAEIYEKITLFLFDIFLAKFLGQPEKSEKEINDFLINYIPKLAVWGSDEVLANFK